MKEPRVEQIVVKDGDIWAVLSSGVSVQLTKSGTIGDDDRCRSCGHSKVFHQIGRGTGVPLGVKYCDDRHADPCSCKKFVPLSSAEAAGELFDRELAAAHAHMDRRDATMQYRNSAEPGAIVGLTGFTPSTEPAIDGHAALVAYLLSAVRRKDWHAVSDAANDLRVLESKGTPR